MKPTRGNFRFRCWKLEIWRYCKDQKMYVVEIFFYISLWKLTREKLKFAKHLSSVKTLKRHRSNSIVICSHTMIIIGVATCPRKCNTRGETVVKTFDFQPTPRQPASIAKINSLKKYKPIQHSFIKVLLFTYLKRIYLSIIKYFNIFKTYTIESIVFLYRKSLKTITKLRIF